MTGGTTLTRTPAKRRAAPLHAVDHHEILSASEITATKHIRSGDPYLEGHYPDFTIYPGVFIIESVLQTVRLLVEATFDAPDEIELSAVASVRFTTPLLPGDTLRIRCVCTAADDGTEFRVKAECHTGAGAKAAQLKLEFRRTGSPGGEGAGRV